MLGAINNPAFQQQIPELLQAQTGNSGFNLGNMLNKLNELNQPATTAASDGQPPVVQQDDSSLPVPQNETSAQGNPSSSNPDGFAQNPFGGLAQNMMDTMRGMMNDVMSGIGQGFPTGEGPAGAGAEGAYANLSYSRVSFQMSASVMSAVNTANGSSAQASSFEFSFSFESFQAQVGIGGGQPDAAGNPLEGLGSFDEFFAKLDQMLGLGGTEEGGEAGEVDATDTTDTIGGINEEIMNAINDYFSPEATANRILDFALSGFPNSSFYDNGGDTQDNRNAFAEFIGGAIQQGFDEAREILGDDIPEETDQKIDDIHSNVFNGLDDFVENGVNDADENENPDNLNRFNAFPYQAASMEAYSFQMSYSFSQTSYNSYASDPAAGAGTGVENASTPTNQDAELDMVA